MVHSLRKYLSNRGSALFMVLSTMTALMITCMAMYFAVVSSRSAQFAVFNQEQSYQSARSISDIILGGLQSGTLASGDNDLMDKMVKLNEGDTITTDGNGFASLNPVDDVTRYFSIYSSTRNKAGYFTEKTRDCYINPDKPDEIYIPAKAGSYYAMRNSSVIFAALGMAFLGMALLIRKNRRFTDTERVVEEGKTLIDRNERIKVHIKGRHILLLLAVVSVFGSLVVLGKAVPGELRYRHLKSICTEERVADLIDSNRTYAGRGRYRIEAKYDLSEGECRIVDTISYVSTLSNNEDVAKSRTYMINPQNENEYYLPLVMDGYLLGIIMGFVFLGAGLLEGIIYLCIRRNNHISKM